ncbi:hypothetical protein TorRG33x02_354650, partial [Trema orientale]
FVEPNAEEWNLRLIPNPNPILQASNSRVRVSQYSINQFQHSKSNSHRSLVSVGSTRSTPSFAEYAGDRSKRLRLLYFLS